MNMPSVDDEKKMLTRNLLRGYMGDTASAPDPITDEDLAQADQAVADTQAVLDEVNQGLDDRSKLPAQDQANYVLDVFGKHPELGGRENGYALTMAAHIDPVNAGTYQPKPKGHVTLDTPQEFARKFGAIDPSQMITFCYDKSQVRLPNGTTFTAGTGLDTTGLNDPTNSNRSNAGSIPPGAYRLVVNDNGHLGKNYYLQPVFGTQTYGRDGLCNHAALCHSVTKDGKTVPTSHGCIVITPSQFAAYHEQVEAMKAQNPGKPAYIVAGTQEQLAAIPGLEKVYGNTTVAGPDKTTTTATTPATPAAATTTPKAQAEQPKKPATVAMSPT